MPQFAPSVQKTAVAPITVAPAGLNCEAELFLGPNDATPVASSGIRTFLSTGSPQQVSFHVVMPATPGAYHVYVDVHAGGQLILAYIGSENVVIASLGLTFGAPWGYKTGCPDSSFKGANVSVRISNPSAASITKRIYCRWQPSIYWPSKTNAGYKTMGFVGETEITWLDVTVPAGVFKDVESPYQFNVVGYGWGCATPLISTGASFYFWFQDQDGNESPAILL